MRRSGSARVRRGDQTAPGTLPPARAYVPFDDEIDGLIGRLEPAIDGLINFDAERASGNAVPHVALSHFLTFVSFPRGAFSSVREFAAGEFAADRDGAVVPPIGGAPMVPVAVIAQPTLCAVVVVPNSQIRTVIVIDDELRRLDERRPAVAARTSEPATIVYGAFSCLARMRSCSMTCIGRPHRGQGVPLWLTTMLLLMTKPLAMRTC
jgi:hypothetical protein